jgi:dTDP-4-amino-4,6-dideoxygalactose transaminase
VLRVKLPHLELWTQHRERNARAYDERFAAAALGDRLVLPERGPSRHVYNQYVVRIPGGRRDAVKAALQAAGIGCAVYYPLALHQQPCFQTGARVAGPMSETERATAEVLALPVAPGLTPDHVSEVVQAVTAALRS